jgi:hypothetical protein
MKKPEPSASPKRFGAWPRGMKGRLGMPRGNPDARIVPIHCDDWARFTQSGEDLAHSFKVLGIASRRLLLEPGVPTTIAPRRAGA